MARILILNIREKKNLTLSSVWRNSSVDVTCHANQLSLSCLSLSFKCYKTKQMQSQESKYFFIYSLYWIVKYNHMPSVGTFLSLIEQRAANMHYYFILKQTSFRLNRKKIQLIHNLCLSVLGYICLSRQEHTGPTVGRLKCFGRGREQICLVYSAALEAFGAAQTSALTQHAKSEEEGRRTSEPLGSLTGSVLAHQHGVGGAEYCVRIGFLRTPYRHSSFSCFKVLARD